MPACGGEYGQPWPMSWLIPARKCWSASALTSRGVARKAGEWSHVHVSDVVTGRPNRCDADEAHRDEVSSRYFHPSPSMRSAWRELEIVAGGSP